MTCKHIIYLLIFIIFLSGFTACAVRGGKQTTRLLNTNESICLDSETGLMWQIRPDNTDMQSPQEVRQYIEESDFGGFTDWRLPTYDELYILHDALEIYKYNDCRMKQEVPVWYVDDQGDIRAGFWYSDPTCGGVDYTFIKKKTGHVRAVRP